jgi:DNA-binding protein HU-beta
MTKAELIEKVAKETDISKALAEKVLNSVTDQVTRCLKKNDKITLTGFGTFSVTKRKARTGRNPQTGAEIKIKATRVPKFKPGKSLKDVVAK